MGCDMSDPVQARAFVADWRGYYAKRPAGPVGLARRLRKTADEQRANLGRTRRAGYQGSKGRAAYEKAVAYLEREATKAEGELVVWREAEELRQAEAEKVAACRRAELMLKYPKVPR